ncbi:HpcH/HpaI aldolase/citrate lyase family protein [Novosphingobium sp. BL-52-GroH]|uniref:HpcH/HpaI aldolase/citrate lyase family protein n=1 Tax=Novosphingobium sp. BL-52-GroH TaxID=3349877 RepID=UPI0038501B5D
MTGSARPGWRSLLFVSADDPARLAKVGERGADAVILDLEDAVAPARKAEARGALPAQIARLHGEGHALVVRVNAGWTALAADLEAAVRPGVAALMLPKVEQAWRIEALAEMLGEWEIARGLPAGAIGIIALVESAPGLAALSEIAQAPRLVGIALGSEDLSLSLGVAPGTTFLDLPARQIALAAGAAGVMALGIPLSIAEFRDMEAYRRAAALALAYGTTGALCIHPAQVAAANAAFAPGDAELAEAHAILQAWDAADGAAVTSLDGRMIDLPVVLRARRLLARGMRTDVTD